jgi:hypothetical protein
MGLEIKPESQMHQGLLPVHSYMTTVGDAFLDADFSYR